MFSTEWYIHEGADPSAARETGLFADAPDGRGSS
jgi:hypothetical protein